MYFQTGDILYKEADFKIKDMKLVKSDIIKLGTATGHAHTIKNGKLYQDKNNNMFIVADDKTFLQHQEHKEIKLPKGKWAVDIVKEYDHFEEESKEVVD